jgi:stage II sporulation protein M
MKVKKRMSWIAFARKYLRETGFYVFLAVALFFFSALVSFLQPGAFAFLDDLLKGLVDKTEGLGTLGLIWFIFSNNISSAFFALFAGMFFGLVPFFNILLNGALLGYVVSKAAVVTGFTGVLLRLLPHGIFELPAIFIGVGLGIKLGMTFFSTYFGFYSKNKKMRFKGAWVLSFMFISLLVLFASAQILSSTRGLAFFVVSFFLLAFFSFWFLLLFFGNTQLRRAQFLAFRYNLSGSFYVFITVILPLLIIAAIIEGLLISFV